jgi:hypothetical protein
MEVGKQRHTLDQSLSLGAVFHCSGAEVKKELD